MTSIPRPIQLWLIRALIALSMLAVLGVIFASQNHDPRIISMTAATALDDQYRPVKITDGYSPTDTFYVSVQVAGYSADAPLMARWRSSNMQPITTSFKGSAAGEGYIGFVLHNEQDWPTGTYFVDILYRDKVLKSIQFQVERSGD